MYLFALWKSTINNWLPYFNFIHEDSLKIPIYHYIIKKVKCLKIEYLVKRSKFKCISLSICVKEIGI